MEENNKIFFVYVSRFQMNEVNENKVHKMDLKIILEEFKNVFCDDIKDLLPKREFNHAIDLVAYVVPGAKAPYLHSFAQKN
jgi:hypothetical protein